MDEYDDGGGVALCVAISLALVVYPTVAAVVFLFGGW